jgi:hypothetical protein
MPGEGSDIVSRLMPDNGSGPSGATRLESASQGGSAADISVTPAVLRTAAGAAHSIAGDLRAPRGKAIADARDAAAALKGWGFGGALHAALGAWADAYSGLEQRVETTGSMIGDAANGFEWSDQEISDRFDGGLS